MTNEERRTVTVTAAVLLLSSVVRFGWEARPRPPVLPPQEVSAALLEATWAELERAERMRAPLAPGERVDPNRAPDVELARLPGIGPALASRIVEDRLARGPFLGADDLLRVRGIGSATLARFAGSLDLDDPPRAPRSGAAVAPPTSPGGPPSIVDGGGVPVDLNRAEEQELQRLPGIGPALAQRIIEFRTRNGPYARAEDLLEVQGIGPATLDRLRPFIRVGP